MLSLDCKIHAKLLLHQSWGLGEDQIALRRILGMQMEQFHKGAQTDELYDIRFFTPDEVTQIVEASGVKHKRIYTLKFGGRMDLLYSAKRVKRILPNIVWPVRHAAVPRLYQFEAWERVERIACVVEF